VSLELLVGPEADEEIGQFLSVRPIRLGLEAGELVAQLNLERARRRQPGGEALSVGRSVTRDFSCPCASLSAV
jgi:hypothetical protein